MSPLVQIKNCKKCGSNEGYVRKDGKLGIECNPCRNRRSKEHQNKIKKLHDDTFYTQKFTTKKICKDCGKQKKLNSFVKDRKNKSGFGARCLECEVLRRNTPKAKKLRNCNKYNIQPEQWDILNGIQEGRCAICMKVVDNLHIDHCHVAGDVRGLLCRKCNLGLGHFQDNVEYLKRAVRYIQVYSQFVKVAALNDPERLREFCDEYEVL